MSEPIQTKSIFKSKTLFINFVIAILPVISDTAAHWVSNHPQWTLSIIAGINFVLRAITFKRLALFATDTALLLLLSMGSLASCAGTRQEREALHDLEPIPVPPQQHTDKEVQQLTEDELLEKALRDMVPVSTKKSQ